MAPERRVSPEQVPARRIPVLVNELAIEDGQTPPPRVGEVGRFPLIFVEARDDQPDTDATVATWQVHAEPGNDGEPIGPGKHWDGTLRDRPPVWPTVLHGDGWSAHWSAPRPVTGQIEVRGTLVGDLGISSRQWVRGRILRARVVTETIDTSDPDQTRHRPIPGRQQLREVDTAPRWYDDGLRLPPDAPVGQWVSPVPADPYVVETGILVELDLDDVPALPLRPAIVPGAVAAHGEDLWVADAQLPLVVRLHRASPDPAAAPPGVTRCVWPGRILPGEGAFRRLHADAEGCWITGPDGIRRVDHEGAVTLIDDRAVTAAHASAASLLVTQLPADPPDPARPNSSGQGDGWRLFRPGREPVEVGVPPGRRVRAVAGDGEGGFALLISDHDSERTDPPERWSIDPAWRAHLAADGTITEADSGPIVHHSALLAGPPALVVTRSGAGGHQLRVLDADLQLGPWRSVAVQAHYLLSAGGRVLALGHTPDAGRRPDQLQHPDDWWPLPGPFTHPESERYDLLTELDPHTGQPLNTTLTQRMIDTHVAVDGAGVVWLPGPACLHTCPPEPGSPARPYDLAALLEHHET